MTLEQFYKEYANTPLGVRNLRVNDLTLTDIYAELQYLNVKKNYMLTRAEESFKYLKEKPPSSNQIN